MNFGGNLTVSADYEGIGSPAYFADRTPINMFSRPGELVNGVCLEIGEQPKADGELKGIANHDRRPPVINNNQVRTGNVTIIRGT
jgi:uncharacterized membrane-anchored protein